MPDYTAKDLAVFSTIISRAACLRGWGAELGQGVGVAVEEVQCMQFRESLYIAGNGVEHQMIADLFRAFGVSSHDSFIGCLKYCHWLLSMPFVSRTAEAGKTFTGAYSPQETATLNFSPESLGHIPGLTPEERTQARDLVRISVLPPAGPTRTLAWFLKKFTSAAALQGLTRPTATTFHYATQYNGVHAINLIQDSTTVHAELKLLRMLAYAHNNNLMLKKTGRVRVGGLKRTCAFCFAWIERYKSWMFKEYNVRIDLPEHDNRAMGGGAGDRPNGVGEQQFGLYVQALFNGAENNNCQDIEAHAPDVDW